MLYSYRRSINIFQINTFLRVSEYDQEIPQPHTAD